MGKLIGFEFRKILGMKALYFCFLIVALIIVFTANLTKSLMGDYFDPSSMIPLSIVDTSFTMILGVLLAIYACDDYSNGTIKNIYGRGYSRFSVYFSIYFVSLFISIVMAVLCFVITYLFGLITTGHVELTTEMFQSIGLQLVAIMGFHAVFFALATMIGKSGGAVAVNLLGPTLLFLLLDLVLSLLKVDNFTFSDYWLGSVINDLAYDEISRELIIRSLIISGSYTVVFTLMGYFVSSEKEM